MNIVLSKIWLLCCRRTDVNGWLFSKISKNLARFKNNFIGPSK